MSEGSIALLLVGTLPSVPTGQSVSFKMLLDHLHDIGIEYAIVDITPRNRSGRRGGVFDGRRILDIALELPRYLIYLVRFRPTVYILIGQSTVAFFRDCLFIWPALLFNCRIVAHLKGGNYDSFYADQPPWRQWFIRRTIRGVDSLVVLSESLRKCFGFLDDVEGKVNVVHNGLPFGVEEVRPVRLSEKEPIKLLYLSNMIESKGYWELLEACRLLKDRNVSFRCRFCGEFMASSDDTRFESAEEACSAFLQAIEDWNLAKEVRWLGVVRGMEKERQLEWAHSFILPTRYVNEGQPVSVIEALAFGKVVISTDYRAIPDMVSHGQNGFLVDSDLPEKIAGHVEYLWQNPGEIARMSRNALSVYQNGFTQDQHLAKLLGLLEPH